MEQYTVSSLLHDFINIFNPDRHKPSFGDNWQKTFNRPEPQKLKFSEDDKKHEVQEILGEKPAPKSDVAKAVQEDEQPATPAHKFKCLEYISQERVKGTELGAILDNIDRRFYSDSDVMKELININPVCIALAKDNLLISYDFMRSAYLSHPEILEILEKSGEKLKPAIVEMFDREKNLKSQFENAWDGKLPDNPDNS